uniref:Uncharacterized protein n=1 Tax=Arcella intermedia TaxID=1963864 RepID=A0A6B2LW01_9EUKA
MKKKGMIVGLMMLEVREQKEKSGVLFFKIVVV